MSCPQHHVLAGSGVPVDPRVPTADWGELRLLQHLWAGWEQARLSAGLRAQAVLVGRSQHRSLGPRGQA